MDKKQAVRGSGAKWRDDVLREKVARDVRVHVKAQELPPRRFDGERTAAVVRRRHQSFVLQDAPNAGATNGKMEFEEFANNPAITPADVLLGEPQNDSASDGTDSGASD
ncbi:MAG: hypothetical protein GXP29_15185 [Planctomycetes bacterium]|nr:hypothetical protein [Planctomycetota bacterium]